MKSTPGGAWTQWRVDLAGLATCLAMAAVLYFAGIAPFLAAEARHRQQKAALAQERQTALDRAGQVRVVRQRLADTQQALAENPLQLQAARQLNQRLARLAELAQECDLKVEEVQPGLPSSSAGGRYDTVPVRLVGSGSYRNAARFMHHLHQRLTDMAIASFELSASRGDGGAASTFTFELVWYTSPTPKSAMK